MIRPDRAGIDSDFVKKNKMERGDFKTIIISSSIILASNYHISE